MHFGKKILSIIGALIKWICFIALSVYFIRAVYEILTSSFDKTGEDFLNAVVCGVTAYAGYRLEKFGKREEGPTYWETATTPDKTEKNVPVAAPAPEPVYKPVIDRLCGVSNGEFMYKFKAGVDLFPHGKKGLAYPELQWDFQIVANLGIHILDYDGLIRSIYIGGGSDEVSHTGAVAYSKGYGSLESFVVNCMKDIDKAESDAGSEYGGWFSFLDYKYIIINAKIKETDIKVEYSNMGSSITVSFSLENGSDGFPYLIDLVSKFGAEDYDLRSYMNMEGNFTKYSLDVETADDSHDERIPIVKQT